jgi:very-short-patch-repair endonuclease
MPHRDIAGEQRQFARRLRSHQTDLETRLWRELRAKRLDGWKFKRQVPSERYIVDFVCFEARLVVEVDGPLHEKPEQKLRDIERDAKLGARGFRTLRFGGDVALGRAVEDIRRALRSTPLPTPR